MSRGEVLYHHAISVLHLYPVRPLEVAVDDRPVAVFAADGDERRGDGDLFAIDAGRDQHHPAGPHVVDRLLNGRELRRHVDRRCKGLRRLLVPWTDVGVRARDPRQKGHQDRREHGYQRAPPHPGGR